MNSTVIDYILLSGVIQGFVFNGFTLFRKKITKTVIWLSAVVFFLSLNNLQAWLIDVGFSSSNFFIKHLLIPWYGLIAPMFFLFLIHYFKIDNKYKPIFRYTVIVFLCEVVIRFILITYARFHDITNAATLIDNYTKLEEIINALIAIVFIAKAIQIVFFKPQLSTFIKGYDNIRWLRLFLTLGVMVILFWVFAIVINLYFKNDWANYPLRLSTSMLLYWIGYQGIYKYDLLRERISLRASSKTMKTKLASKVDDQSPASSPHKYLADFQRISDHIVENKHFLNANYNQEHLSNDLNMSVSHISKVINACHNSNFSDYINAYRVEQAKKMLSDSKFKNYTIVAIGLESGFNSKSAFYASFRKLASQTPTEYRAGNN